jgi:hypothetical protein
MYFQGAVRRCNSPAPRLYEIRIFVIMSIRAHRLALFRVIWIQSTLFHFNYIRFALILLSHQNLSLLSGLFLSGFPTKTLYAFLFQLNYIDRLSHRSYLSC